MRNSVSDTHTMHSHDELILLSDLNFWEAYRDMTRRSKRGAIWEENGLLLHASNHPCPAIVNGVKRTDTTLAAEDVLAQATTFFGQRGHGYTLNIRMHADQELEDALLKAGFILAFETPVMIIEQRLPTSIASGKLTIKQVTTEDERRDFILVAGEAYEIYPGMQGMVQSVFDEPRSLIAPHIAAFVAYFNGTPVSTAITMVSYQAAFVGWIATRPAFRGQGFGESITQAATNAGFELGAKLASLQASPQGYPLYRKMGYLEISRYREYMPPLPQAS